MCTLVWQTFIEHLLNAGPWDLKLSPLELVLRKPATTSGRLRRYLRHDSIFLKLHPPFWPCSSNKLCSSFSLLIQKSKTVS